VQLLHYCHSAAVTLAFIKRIICMLVVCVCCSFKYNPELVKQLLERKRAAGKPIGSVAERRARLTNELNIARQEGKPEEVVLR
jgi:hypothetical protein